jgi:hypothetical protein
MFLICFLYIGAEARQVAISLNWFFEASKMPVGYTVDQAYGNTDKLVLYQSNDMAITWKKIGEFSMSGFPLPAPAVGWPVKFNIDLADGAKYLIHFSMTGVNKLGQESVKSNLLPISIDLTMAAVTVPPTIRTITITIIVP